MAEGACLVPIDRERLVKEQDLAEQGQPLRAAGHRRGHPPRCYPPAVRLLRSPVAARLGVAEPHLPWSKVASPALLRRWSESTAIETSAIDTSSGHLKAGDDRCSNCTKDDHEPGRHRPQRQQHESHDPERKICRRKYGTGPYGRVERG